MGKIQGQAERKVKERGELVSRIADLPSTPLVRGRGDSSDESPSWQGKGDSVGNPERAHDTAWLAKSSSITLGGGLVGRALQGVIQVVLARLLGPASYGLYAIGWALVRTANVIAPFGLNNGVIDSATRYVKNDHGRFVRVLRFSLGFALLSGILIGLALFMAAPVLGHRIYKKDNLLPLICLFAFAVPLANGLRVASASTRVSQSMKYSVYSESLAQPISNLVLIVCFYVAGWRLLGAAAAAVISFGIAFALALSYEWSLFSLADPGTDSPGAPVLQELLKFSLISWIGAAFANLVPLVDRLFVGAYLAPSDVGIYQAAAQAAFVFGIVEGAFNLAIAPRISFFYQTDQSGRLSHTFRVATKWVTYGCIPFLLIFCFSPEKVLEMLYGARYVSGANPLIILSITWFLAGVASPAGMLLIFAGRQKLYSLLAAGGLGLSLILNCLLIPRFGMVGAALGTGLANLALALGSLIGVRSRLGIWPWDCQWLKGILATGVSAAALFFAKHLEIHPASLNVLFMLVISTVVFTTCLAWLGLDIEDRVMLGTLRGHILALAGAPAGDTTVRR